MRDCNVVALTSVMIFLNMDQWYLRLSLLWQRIITSQYMVAIKLKFLQNIMVSLMNAIFLIPSIRNGLRQYLKNYSVMLLF